VFIQVLDLAHMQEFLARNLDGTRSRYEWVVEVKPQFGGLKGVEEAGL
jgi:hypothetical protein